MMHSLEKIRSKHHRQPRMHQQEEAVGVVAVHPPEEGRISAVEASRAVVEVVLAVVVLVHQLHGAGVTLPGQAAVEDVLQPLRIETSGCI